MKKVLCFVRVSTEAQSLEDQHNEMREFIISEGYSPEGIVWLEERGASAASLNQKYLEMIEKMKKMIEGDPEIVCVAAWHLNRIARREEAWVGVKTFLVQRGIQLLIKNPYLKLLTPEGKVDSGIELAVGLLAILAKQENDERMEKLKRAKKSIRKSGKWQGGPSVKYGYMVDKDRYIVPDPEKAEDIRLIYSLYSTGEFSTYTLTRELKERGYNFTKPFIADVLGDAGYCGGETPGVPERRLPAIISQELFERCKSIRKSKQRETKGSVPVYGARLIKCPICGGSYTKTGINYRCIKHNNHECPNDITIRSSVIEYLLLDVASHIYFLQRARKKEETKKDNTKKIEVLVQKISTAEKKLELFPSKKEKVIDLYVEGLLDKSERDRRLGKIDEDKREIEEKINQLKEKKSALEGDILTRAEYMNSVRKDYAALRKDKEEANRVIHQIIERVVITREEYKGERGVRIAIFPHNAEPVEYIYIPMKKKGNNLYSVALGAGERISPREWEEFLG